MASILLAGLNHRTATIDIRERFSLNSCGLDVVHGELRRLAARSPALEEVVVISTCNRLEVYAAVGDSAAGFTAIGEYLADLYGADRAALDALLYYAEDEAAVRHLMRVTSGLDSLILGEPQILGQVADAFAAAKAAGSHGPILSHLFSYALHCGKRARTETAIGSHTISISHSAALLAEQKLGPLAHRHALVIGAGEMAELAALALQQHGVAAITCVNRTQERAERIAGRVSGRALGWGDLEAALLEADLVISATSAPHVILPAAQIAAVQARREGRPLLLIDIALPRDIDDQVDAVAGVQRYDIDHLRDAIDANLLRRQAAIPDVERIIAGEAACYLYWLNERRVVPTLVELRRRAEATAEAELARTLQKIKHHLGHGSGEEQLVEQEVAQLAHRLVAKLLHTPTVRLKAHAAHGNGSEYVQALTDLFGLETAPLPEVPAQGAAPRSTAYTNGTAPHG